MSLSIPPMIARPEPLAHSSAGEPDPDHRRDERPPLPHRPPHRPVRTTSGPSVADERRLGADLLRRVRQGDAVAEAHGRTVPRTAAGMKARLIERGGMVA